jgi:hypothetical protein
MFIMRE